MIENADKTIKEAAELKTGNLEELKKVVEELRQVAIKAENANKQEGTLDDKFGDYTEDTVIESISRILDERFEADYYGWVKLENTQNALDLEVDAIGVSRKGAGAVYVVKFKSKFGDEHINQVWRMVERFRIHYPECWERAVYPMLTVVDISEAGRRKVWNAGIHLIEVNDGVFQYATPPKDFEPNGYHSMHGARRTGVQMRLVTSRDHL